MTQGLAPGRIQVGAQGLDGGHVLAAQGGKQGCGAVFRQTRARSQCTEQAGMAQGQAHIGHARRTQGGEQEFLDFQVGLDATMAE